MNHDMNVNERAFGDIRTGKKFYEIRLNDEKRRKIKVGDFITFSNASNSENKIRTLVTELVIEDSFEKLFTQFPPEDGGWLKDSTPEKCASDMRKYYSPEDENKYGVVAIKIKLVK